MYVRWLLYCRAYTAILHIMLLWTALFHFQELIPSLHNDIGALNIWFCTEGLCNPSYVIFSLNV